MNDATLLKQPAACTEPERRAFERLVRQGFDGSDETLPDRILFALGFVRAGRPYARRDEVLALFVRP